MVTSVKENTENNTQEILVNIKNNIAVITLNRSKALNALSFNMIELLTKYLLEFKNNNNIKAVIIKSDHNKAFCAGGDIKSLYTNGRNNPEQAAQFFYHEYRLNTLIHNYPKPYIAILNNITMGGGVGISIHGSHKIATDNLVLAMPETSIGFYPDIGASYFLSRLSDGLGLYLGLTGYRLNCLEAKYLNLVNYIIANNNKEELINNIINNSDNNNDNIENIITKYNVNNSYLDTDLKNNIKQNLEHIKTCFNNQNIAQIFENLNNYKINQIWAEKTLKLLNTKSPSSLIITTELLNRAKNLNFKQCMQMEYGLSYGFLLNNDFYEGIRALLIDKDNKPNWDNIDISDYQKFDYGKYFIENFYDKLDLDDL